MLEVYECLMIKVMAMPSLRLSWRFCGSGSEVFGMGLGILGLGFETLGLGFKVLGLGFEVLCLGVQVSDWGSSFGGRGSK